MEPTAQNLRFFSLICVGLCFISAVAVFACLCRMILLSADAEQLFRTWRVSQLLFFACLCSYFAMGCGLEVLSRRVPRVREQIHTPTPSSDSTVMALAGHVSRAMMERARKAANVACRFSKSGPLRLSTALRFASMRICEYSLKTNGEPGRTRTSNPLIKRPFKDN